MSRDRYSVLNVDDDDENRYAISLILKKAGFDVIEARNGSEALSRAKDLPDLILLDVNLPDINGFEICKKIKKNQETSSIPVLLISATRKESDSIAKGLNIGADGFLTQPIDHEILIAWVRALLRLKEAEATAREKAREWEETFNSIVFPMFLLGSRGEIINMNNSAKELFKIKNEKVLNKPINELLKTNDFPEKALWHEIKAVDGNYRFSEFRHNERDYILSITKIGDKSRPVDRYLYILYDETDRKNLEKKLYQAQRLESIGRLTAGIAHDFNNMLTVIIGYTDMLLFSMPKNDKIRNIIEEINKAGKRASDLIQNLLTFSRKHIVEPSIENINDIINEMTKLLTKVIGEDIELIQRLDDELYNVYIDRSQFEQVIMNLVINARDAMPEGGKLIIETKKVTLDDEYAEKHREITIKKGEYVMLAISDNGVGMDRETMAHIFEPFFTTKADRGGTGLGLSIVYGIVKKSGGYIWVYSEPGLGTTFKIYIPRIKTEEEVHKRKKERKSEILRRGNETILVVEDDDQIRDLIKKSLSDFGYRVLTSPSPEEALKICKSDHIIDLLITDIVLPGKNGKQLFDELKRIINNLKVLYTSGYTETVVSRKGIVKNGIAFLAKPFTPTQLLKKVGEILEK